ncbi:hypothetical protein B296_00028140 [Ensete ventricosum]|uniref:Uncharacterized protein n=1 Tax=Ensete ventricosum TaxID=4639 RepID=A0A426Z402_ENSVE|nr:hypothetical protein B296_00028140 [Ensete ventricosum]
MAEDCPLCFHEAMNKLWFQQNILYLEPPGDSLPSSMEKMKAQEVLMNSRVAEAASSATFFSLTPKKNTVMDLGFTFPREKLGPQLMTTVPALQRLAEEGEGRRIHSNEGYVKRPYLSETWRISSHGSPQFDLQMLGRSPQGADMKKHLLFWARKVASIVRHES